MKYMDTDAPVIRYIALIDSLKRDNKWLADPAQISYAFHTFSLRNEHVYAPTGDVSFVSPNTDPRNLDGGIERLIDAVLHLTVTTYVISVDTARTLLELHTQGEKIEVSPGFSRTYEDLQALVQQSEIDHPDNH